MTDNKINYNALTELIRLYMPDFIILSREIKLKINNFESYNAIYNYNILKSKNDFKKKLNENLFLLQSTSGTTGSPKNVRLSYLEYFDQAASLLSHI